MSTASLLRVVIDTNVVFEGLTKQGGAAGLVIDAWLAGLLEVCVSNTLAYEYDAKSIHRLCSNSISRVRVFNSGNI